MRRAPVLTAFVLLLLAGSAVAADDVSLSAEVDAHRIGVKDLVQLTITVSGRSLGFSEDVALPPLQNLRLAGGPSVSTQVSFVNGAVSQSKSYTYVLQPVAVGQALIGSVRLKLPGGEKATPPITVEVVAGSVRPQEERRPADPFGDDPFESFFGRRRAARPAAPAKLLVEVQPSRTRLHVGEALLLTYSLYTQTSITDIRFSETPQYPGFWSEDLERPAASPGGEPASVEGESYRRFAFLQKLLFPTKAGTLTIPQATLKIGLPRTSFWNPADVAVERATRPVVVTADPIPADPSFSGAVGHFRVSASVDHPTLALGDAVTLRLRVEGSGNLKWVDRGPELIVPGAKVYPPQLKSDLKPGPGGITGTKTWEFVVVPETSGPLEVPPLAFSYFDPAAGRIVRAETAPIPLRVEGGAPGSTTRATVAAGSATHAEGLVLRSDLDLRGRRLPVLGSFTLALGLLAVLALHGAAWAGATLAERRGSGTGRVAPRRSVRAALAELQRASRGGANLTKEAAAALIEKTLHEVFGPLTDGSGPAASDRDKAARQVLQEVEFLRYAPQLGDYSEKIREVSIRAAEVVRRWA